MNGRIAVGWLVVEDLATVLFLVLLPALASVLGGGVGASSSTVDVLISISKMLLQIGAFIALMLVVGRRVLPILLGQVARLGSRELFTLVVIAIAISIAYGAAKLFQVSFALGAFFAGMVMCESEFSHRAAKESLPLRDAFSVLFFVSVGMLFDPRILVEQPISVLAVVAIIVIGKSIAALGLVLAFRYPLNTALIVSTSLAQIGEFSFILAGLAVDYGLMTVEGMGLILAGALISIALNPFLFRALSPFQAWLLKRSLLAQRLARRQDPYAELPMSTERKYLQDQIVLVGYGEVGRRIGKELAEKGIHTIVVEQNRELVENLRKGDRLAVSGNATDPAVLIQAHITNASMLLITIADSLNVRQMIDTAKMLNPDIEIVLRTHSESESKLLKQAGADKVFFDEELIATGMIEHALEKMASQKRA